MFVASHGESDVIATENTFIINMWDEVNTSSGWMIARDLSVGDSLLVDDKSHGKISVPTKIKSIETMGVDLKISV